VVLLTVALFASGVALLFAPTSWRGSLLQLHQASFIAWFILMAGHVLGHIGDVVRFSTKDWTRRTRGLVSGSRVRRLVITLSLLAGLALALLTVSHVGLWTHGA
jgi:cytochrome c biogenesis protein CcdA